MNFLIRDLTTN